MHAEHGHEGRCRAGGRACCPGRGYAAQEETGDAGVSTPSPEAEEWSSEALGERVASEKKMRKLVRGVVPPEPR